MKKTLFVSAFIIFAMFLSTGCGSSNEVADGAEVVKKFKSGEALVCYSKPYTIGGKKYKQAVSRQGGWELIKSDRSSQGYIFKKDIEEHLPSECVLN